MKRIKDKDWTRVLQERLQDAQLPLEDDASLAAESSRRAAGNYFSDKFAEKPISAPLSAANENRRQANWWPFALAGVAAAVAAVLLLRPASRQEPDRLVEQNNPPAVADTLSSPVPYAGQAEPAARQTDVTNNASDSAGQTATGLRTSAHRLPQDSVSVAVADSASVTPGLTRSLLAEESREIPDQAGDDKKAVGDDRKVAGDEVRPLSELALADLPEEPERGRRTWSGRVALRVQAATAGRSLSGDAVSMNVPQTIEVGRWIAYEDISSVTQDSFEYVGSSDSYVNNGELSGQQTIKWIYVREVAGTTNNLVLVPKAPAVPVALGVSLSLPLARSWSLSAGLDYAQRDGYRLYGDMPQSLTLHYLGVPVDLHYYFNPDSRWRFYLGAGLHAAKCIYASGGQPLKDPVLFSGNLSAGTDFRIFPGVRVYLAPALTAPFNRSAYVNTWDDRPAFQLRVGLSFDLK